MNFTTLPISKELISVILPTYNRADYLLDSINSILSQEDVELELIIVDDGSTDQTSKLLSKINDPRLVVINQLNLGVSAARNAALRASKGSFIAFMDSDDIYKPFKLRKQLNFLVQNSEFDVVYTDSNCINQHGNIIPGAGYSAPFSGKIYNLVTYFRPLTITIPSVMMHRYVYEKVGFFDENLTRFEDTDYWRRVSKIFSFGSIPEIMVSIRTHSGNTLESQSMSSIINSIEQYIKKIESEDYDYAPLAVRHAGYKRLCQYYIEAFETLPDSEAIIKKLKSYQATFFKPLVSIIIPVYNGSNFLSEAIDSALNQTYENIEILVVNDGSSDNQKTDQVAYRYGSKIKYFKKSNGGVASALNFALKKAKGEYISWLSHDDIYPSNKVELQVDFLSRVVDPSRTILYGDYAVFSGFDQYINKPVYLRPPPPDLFRYFITVKNLLHGCTLLLPSTVFREVGYFDETLRTTQDYDLWFRLASSFEFVHIPRLLVYARSHADQGTASMSDIVSHECDQLLSRFVEQLTHREVLAISSLSLSSSYASLSQNLKSRGFQLASAKAESLSRSYNSLQYKYPNYNPSTYLPSKKSRFQIKESKYILYLIFLFRTKGNGAFRIIFSRLKQKIFKYIC